LLLLFYAQVRLCSSWQELAAMGSKQHHKKRQLDQGEERRGVGAVVRIFLNAVASHSLSANLSITESITKLGCDAVRKSNSYLARALLNPWIDGSASPKGSRYATIEG
jgi:hypothetical protein